MEGGRPQFDMLLGGGEDLPQDFSLMDFACARAQEIISISEALQEPRRTGLVFQRLPRHMRRRIMSHNAKRMPRQLREAHQRQMEKGGLPPKSKRPSRKYRRRPSNLLEAYNRRQKENIWLETHIWHAKRFHMINKWGYKLPHFPNDKSARACYRGSVNHCLLQDISYYICIELKGSFESIINGLKMLTRQECGLSFRAKLWCKGDREGSVMLYHSDVKYPHGAIGRVSFLWKPLGRTDSDGKSAPPRPWDEGREDASGACGARSEERTAELDKKCVSGEGGDSDEQRTLWLWVHPSYFREVKGELIRAFEFQQCPPVIDGGSREEPPHKRRKSDKSLQTGDESRGGGAQPRGLCSQVEQFFGSNVKMSLLKDALVRLRLTGPLSSAVLREALVPVEGGQQAWASLGTSGTSPHAVLPLSILDPRDNLPPKRTKAEAIFQTEAVGGVHCPPPSPIWDPQARDIATTSKPSDAQVNCRHSENLVPGLAEASDVASTSAGNVDAAPRIPILLVQRPGSQIPSSKRLGYGCGWDVIAPTGWGKPLWVAMVMRGARAAGLREAEALVGDAAVGRGCEWPAPPDTSAARLEAELFETEAKQNYFKLPPSKRPKYIQLGISSPFACPWELLCREWSSPSAVGPASGNPSCDTFYVLRNIRKLEEMSKALRSAQKDKSSGGRIKVSNGHNVTRGVSEEESPKIAMDVSGCCLVPVKVTISGKGVVARHSVICLPQKVDFVGGGELRGAEEPPGPDPYKERRAEVRREHRVRLRSLRRKRRRGEAQGDDDGPPPRVTGAKATEDICAQHRRQMEGLFLPEVLCARKSCSREVAGYVTAGGFSLTEARETGCGYIALPALVSLIKTSSWNRHLLVFVRNTYSSHYVPATVEIVTN